WIKRTRDEYLNAKSYRYDFATIDFVATCSYNSVCTHKIREFWVHHTMLSPVTYSFLGMPAVVRSQAMENLLSIAERVARTNATVLITGETGSGKELIARALHHYSLRHSKPWVDVNCAALPEHLVESELFGYEKGAFSG